ncbi:MAG: type II secretion system protein [Planctomycetes bacterium]|nr:type II secretion system protein [Planctomycetota bacterium]
MHNRRGFTLIELLVVIAIISILMGLILPSLAGSRRTARSAAGFANMRSVATVLLIYTTDHQEDFLNPFRASWQQQRDGIVPQWSEAVSSKDPHNRWDFLTPICQACNTEGFSSMWYSYLAEYRGEPRYSPVQVSPNDADVISVFNDAKGDPNAVGESHLFPSSFLYSPVFWSKPERYAGSIRGSMLPDMIRTALQSSVIKPSAKVVVWERADFAQQSYPNWASVRARTHIALVDGSCDTVDMGDLTRRALDAIATPDTNDDDLAPCDADLGNPLKPFPLFFFATRNGVKGRDIAR